MRWLIIVLTSIALMAPLKQASAHAQLDHAQPGAGAQLKVAPAVVDLWFTQAVEPKFSSIVVQDTNGTAMQDGAVLPAPGNTAQLMVKLKPLAPGVYKVLWRVLSVDTHRTQGSFSFSVGP